MPTDQELIARIAEKLGWEEVYDYEHDTKICCWAADKGKSYSKTELPSTDACLALLDKPWAMQQFSDGNVEFSIYDAEANKTWEAIEDMEPGMSQVYGNGSRRAR